MSGPLVKEETLSDSGWEDIPSEPEQTSVRRSPRRAASPSITASDGTRTPTRTSTRSSTLSSSPARRRKPAARAIHVASPTSHSSTVRKERARQAYGSPRPATPTPSGVDIERWQRDGGAALRTGAVATADYAGGVLVSAAKYLRFLAWFMHTPLALGLVLYLAAFAVSRLTNQIRTAIAPICAIPGASRMIPLCSMDTKREKTGPQWANFTALAETEAKSFERLLGESAGGSGLALELKRAEMATSDLAVLVRESELTSRDMVADTLGEFVADARKAARGLQKFHSKVGGAVDGILAVNDYALRSIEVADTKSHTLSARAQALIPFGNRESVREVVLAQFSDAMAVASAQLARLILDAEANAAALDALEERLHVLHGQLTREDRAFRAEVDDVLADLWTKLGGNRKKLRNLGAHQALLRELGGYRRAALARVAGALQALHGMSADMEELRERVAAPELVGARVPVEVHVSSIRNGLERLKEGRMRAREIEDAAMKRVLGEAID